MAKRKSALLHDDLATFLARFPVQAEGNVVWNKDSAAPTPLYITAHFTNELPPLDYVTSVRAVVLSYDSVLALTMPDRTHIMPGGRREAGESPEETVCREVLEESGWTIRLAGVIGVMRFHNLGPRQTPPPGHRYRYVYPDFLNLVYLAEAVHHNADLVLPNDGEPDPFTLQPLADVQRQVLSAEGRLFLDAALARRPHA